LKDESKRWLYAVWVVAIGGFAVLHGMNLLADFPNYSPWSMDWAKYTDEGWYGSAAVRAHLFGSWYVAGDFNPAAAVPVWPFLEWVLFFFTGVTLSAARGLAVGLFFVNLVLSYWLVRARGARWTAMLAVTLLVTSPFLYCFSRLAILEPLLTALTLVALNLAVRLDQLRRPVVASAGIGLIFTLMLLTKTTALFLLPALALPMIVTLWKRPEVAIRCAAVAAGAAAASFGAWMALIAARGLMADYRYYFFVNNYAKPPEWYWPVLSLWWSFHGGLWVDHILIPLAGLLSLAALVCWRSAWARQLLLDPLFGASVWASIGYVLFMTIQNHPQPRYFALVAFFCIFLVAMGAGALKREKTGGGSSLPVRVFGWIVVGLAVFAAATNGAWMLGYASHPQYTWVRAATALTNYIDTHPNGNRLLVSVSGDDITLMTHLPTLCDDFGTMDLPDKLAKYQPGWYASWNDLDPGSLEDLHTHYSLEQVAEFPAFDDPERTVLVLFKLHPLAGGMTRTPQEQNLQVPLPDDKIDVSIE
jgi:hypothetical protein